MSASGLAWRVVGISGLCASLSVCAQTRSLRQSTGLSRKLFAALGPRGSRSAARLAACALFVALIVDAYREAHDAFAKVADAVRDARWPEAIAGLHALAAAEKPLFYPRWDAPNRYVSSAEVAHRVLGVLPDEAIRLYAQQNDPAARRLHEEAIAAGSEPRLLAVARSHFQTPFGARALDAFGVLAFDRGDPLAGGIVGLRNGGA
jgi:hypothetical protein